MYLQSHIYKNIPVSFDFITTWNQGVFLCSPCTIIYGPHFFLRKKHLNSFLFEVTSRNLWTLKISKYLINFLEFMKLNEEVT
jgi:hypothetical protein